MYISDLESIEERVRDGERASMASWLSRIPMFSTNRQQMLTPSTQSAAPRGSRFHCSAGQAGFFTRLGRLIKEKAKSDVDKLFSGFTKTRDNLAVIDELLLYWNLADTDRVLEELVENTAGRLIEVLSLTDIVMNETKNPSTGMDTTDYFAALCQQSFTSPLVGGSVGMKDVNKWVDERIMNYDNSNFREGKSMMMLYALLKVACQHYGKLQSPFGSDYPLPEKESPELAVANLFASLKTNCQTIHRLIQNWPSEGQVQATAYEVEHLLVNGRKKEALKCAKQCKLWGPCHCGSTR